MRDNNKYSDKEKQIFNTVVWILRMLIVLFASLSIAFSISIYQILIGSINVKAEDIFSAVNLGMFQVLIALITLSFAIIAVFGYSSLKNNLIKVSKKIIYSELSRQKVRNLDKTLDKTLNKNNVYSKNNNVEKMEGFV